MPIIDDFQVRMNTALGVLGDVKSLSRTFLTDPSALRELANQELEQNLTYDSMAKMPGFRNVLANLHADEFHPDPEDRDAKGRQNRFNSNHLRKLSSGITLNATAAIMLAGQRVAEDGTQKNAGVDKDIEIAVLLHDMVGARAMDTEPHHSPSLNDLQRRVVDDEFIREKFGDNVLRHVKGINESLTALQQGTAEDVAPEYASAVAAISAARVREAAKIVSQHLVERLDAPIREAFLRENNLSGENPAQQLLEREFAKLQSVMQRSDIAAEVRAPIADVLMPAIEQYQADGNSEKLFGNPQQGNGTAYGAFNAALPINRYKTVEKRDGEFVDYTDLDVYKMLLFQTRYHQDTLRKDGSTIFSHVLDTVNIGSNALGGNLRNLVTLVLGLHDALEDGGREVAGFDLDASKLAKDFGTRMALLVAEMTDGYGKKDYTKRALKAYNEGGRRHDFVESKLREFEQIGAVQLGDIGDEYITHYLQSTPFNLATAGAKIADVASTARKSLEHPEVNQAQWRNSGARSAWLGQSKGYVDELYQAIADRVEAFMKDPHEHTVLPSGHNEMELNLGLLNFLSATKQTLDQYTLQNLTIIADEFGLDGKGRETLRDKFTDTRRVSDEQFTQYLAENLKLEDGAQSLHPISDATCDQKTGVNMTTLHHKDSKPGMIQPQYEVLLSLRHQFSQREMSRKALHATLDNTAVTNSEPLREALERTTQAPDWRAVDHEVVSRYDEAMDIDKPRRSRVDLGTHTLLAAAGHDPSASASFASL